MGVTKKEIIIRLLQAGASYREIAEAAECSKSTISYHAEKLGLSQGETPRYNWEEIQKYHDEGHRRSECIKRFGFSKAAWDDAVKAGRIKPRDHRIPISELVIEGRNTMRAHLKRRLLQAGLLEPKCYYCGITEWLGKPVSLELHHKDGNGKNNLLENLLLLCPNCHSQTTTWGGKNKKLRRSTPDS
jgi:5-methylcytosine-specific restriction endonuclease McrA